jgi:hypothetical protein
MIPSRISLRFFPALAGSVWLLAGALALQAAAPVVSNVRASQRPGTKFVDIYYDVSDPDSSALSIWILISSDGGATYGVPASSFSGAVGGGVTPGANKYAQWNAGADWHGRIVTQARVIIGADDATSNVPTGMAYIPPGPFQMGDTFNEGNTDERPLHNVFVSAFSGMGLKHCRCSRIVPRCWATSARAKAAWLPGRLVFLPTPNAASMSAPPG